MFEQDRYTGDRRSHGLFRGEGEPAPGMSRFQVSGENDPAEIQAEQMADSVVGGGLFRSPEGSGGSGFQADLDTADLGDAGESLPGGLQSSMEQSFGTGFSGVRIHTGAGADRASRSISARAFTQGQDVYFRSGAYDPESREGQHLIAHELAHVAAGDGGIHRDPDSDPAPARPTTGMSRQDILEMALRSDVEHSKEDLARAEEMTQSYSNKELLLNQVALGAVEGAKLRSECGQVDAVKSRLDSLIDTLHRNMESYVDEVAGSGAEDAAKERAKNSPAYKQAAETLAKLEHAGNELQNTVKPVLTNVLDKLKEGNSSGGPGFPETVANMLDNPACAQFFKAVSQVRGGAGGNFDTLNQSAVDSAGNLHRDVGEFGSKRVGRMSGNVGAITGAVSTAADVISGGTGIDAAAHTEVNQHSRNASTVGGILGATAGIVGTGASAVGAGAEMVAVHQQEAKRQKKIEEMQKRNGGTGIGAASKANHAGRTAVAGQVVGTLGSAAGAVSTVADLSDSEKVSDIAGVTGSTLGVAGSTLGLAAESLDAKEKKKKDEEAKQSMKALGKQLRATLSNNNPNPKIEAVCNRLEGKRFNAGKGENDQLGKLITEALVGVSDAKQKNLLMTLKALEASRLANKGAMAEARKNAMFSTVGLAGSLTSMAGSIASMAGSKLAGAILGMVGTVIGMVGTIRDVIGVTEKAAERQQGRNEERDAKVAACQAAVGQMATLPELDLNVLKGKREKKLPLDAAQQEAAEQYASVFTLIKTADVNMVDFLYAVDQGNFGGTDENGADLSTEASLKAMYEKLDFS